MQANTKVQIFNSEEALALAVANFILLTAKEAIRKRGKFVLALSGGHTPEILYTLLSKPPFFEQVPWKDTYVFWGDERCLPSYSDQNNAHLAKVLLLDNVGIPEKNIYPVPVLLPPKEAAADYAKTISLFFGDLAPQFDLILLGLGENGHTASLFPYTHMVFDPADLVKEVYLPEQKMLRITMAPGLINQAREILFLVSGANKAGILQSVLTSTYDPEKLPAQLIKPVNGCLNWYVDSKAAVLLPDK